MGGFLAVLEAGFTDSKKRSVCDPVVDELAFPTQTWEASPPCVYTHGIVLSSKEKFVLALKPSLTL